MAPSTEYPPSADPVMHSFISIALILPSPPDGPSGGANLLWTWLLHSVGKKQILSIPGRGCAALMCHAICVDWLMFALSSTRFCQHEQAPTGNALDYVPVFPLSTEWPWGYCARTAGRSTPISCSIVEAVVRYKWSRLFQLYVIGWTNICFFTLATDSTVSSSS